MYTIFNRTNADRGFWDEFVSPFFAKERKGFPIDLIESADSYTVISELPGVDKSEVAIDYEDERLTITVTRKTSEEETTYLHRERRACDCERSVFVKNIDPAAIKAKLDNGILTVTMPKAGQEGKKVKIEL